MSLRCSITSQGWVRAVDTRDVLAASNLFAESFSEWPVLHFLTTGLTRKIYRLCTSVAGHVSKGLRALKGVICARMQ